MTKVQINIRIDDSDLKLIKEICFHRGTDASSLIRFLIKKELGRLGYLSKFELKALEIKN